MPEARRRRFRAVVVVLAGVVAASLAAFFVSRGGSARGPHFARGSLAGANVLLVTMDTTRADHLPMYGYRGVATPGLDRVAADGLVFENAIAHAPLTLPSHTSILTGLLPIAHGVRDNEGFRLDEKVPLLSEMLRAHGYATGAFVSAFVLDSRFGLDRGFDVYHDDFNLYQEVNLDQVQRRAEETEAAAEAWLSGVASKPFFAWVHFYDPHDPYDPPEPFASRYAANRYDGEIAYMDRSIGRLLDALEGAKVADRTIVVVTGDHGEGLGEHGELTHAMFLYRTTLHVPLLIRIPGGRGARIPGVVRHVDLVPTLLDLLGIDPPAGLQGASLLPRIDGSEPDARPAYSESLYAQYHYGWSPLTALTAGKYDLIASPKPELYDHAADPAQRRNLLDAKASIAESMKERLDELVASGSRRDLSGPKPVDPDTEAKLRSLGYLGSSAPATAESLKIDPKDKSAVIAAVYAGMAALSRKDFQGALQYAVPVTQSDPGIVDAHYIAGTAYANLQAYDPALDQLFKVLAIKPDHATSLATVGWVYEGKGDLDEAERWYQKVLRVDPESGLTLVRLAGLYRRMNEASKADTYFARAVGPIDAALATTREPAPRSRLYAVRAEANFGAGRLDAARSDLEAAIALTPQEPKLHFNLAQICEQRGDVAGAIAQYREEARVAPPGADALMNLGMLFVRLRRFDEAAATYEALARAVPQDPRPGVLLAEAYLRSGKNLDQALLLARQGLAQMGEAPEIYLLIASIEQSLGHAPEAAAASARARALQGR